LKPILKYWGLMAGLNEFWGERMNGMLQRIKTNHHLLNLRNPAIFNSTSSVHARLLGSSRARAPLARPRRRDGLVHLQRHTGLSFRLRPRIGVQMSTTQVGPRASCDGRRRRREREVGGTALISGVPVPRARRIEEGTWREKQKDDGMVGQITPYGVIWTCGIGV
ncbi:hypothetical protein B0H10DRAFT_1958620, partial [Mycena sp. CBHHK59/15]